MEHVVFYPALDGAAFVRTASLDEAVAVVEHLRNQEGVTEVSVHALTEVPLAFRPYYRVELAGAPAVAAPAPVSEPVPVEEPAAADAAVETAPVEAALVEAALVEAAPVEAAADPVEAAPGEVPPARAEVDGDGSVPLLAPDVLPSDAAGAAGRRGTRGLGLFASQR